MATEKRLIDGNELIREMRRSDEKVGTSIWETSEIADFIDEQPTVDAVEVVHGRWIPASEPPKEWKDDENGVAINYLVFCPDLGIDIGNYVKPANMWFCLGVPVPVTHWMPLPEPPKEDGHD